MKKLLLSMLLGLSAVCFAGEQKVDKAILQDLKKEAVEALEHIEKDLSVLKEKGQMYVYSAPFCQDHF